MKNPLASAKTNPNPVPKVLLRAKEEAVVQTSGKREPEKPWERAWEKGPWDKGHWANRK